MNIEKIKEEARTNLSRTYAHWTDDMEEKETNRIIKENNQEEDIS
jgi:hypothetical protein